MPVNQATGYKRTTNEPLDVLYLNSGSVYSSTASVNAAVPMGVRYTGSMFNVNGVIYWYEKGVQDSDLVKYNPVPDYATTGSNLFRGDQTVNGSVHATGSFVSDAGTSSFPYITSSVSDTTYQYVNEYTKYAPVTQQVSFNETGSYIYTSGSNKQLFFAQVNGERTSVVKLDWMVGNLYTGLLSGGLLSSQSSTVYQISSGSGIIVTYNQSFTSNPQPTVQYLKWPNLTASIAPSSSQWDQEFVAIKSDGTIMSQATPFQDGQFDTMIPIGLVVHQNHTSINGFKSNPSVGYGLGQRHSIFTRAFGPLKLSGFGLYPSASSTGSLTIGSGTSYADGANYTVDPNNPSYVTDPGTSVSRIIRYYNTSSYNDWIYDTNAGAGYGAIDPTRYSNNGALTLVPGTGSNKQWSVQRVFWFPNSAAKSIVVYYGNAAYTTKAEAIANLNIEPFVEAPNTAANAVYVGALIVRNDASFLDSTSYAIIPGGLFRSVGGSGGGGSVVTDRLVDLSDVAISGPTSGQALVYDSAAMKWVNASYISASVSGSAETLAHGRTISITGDLAYTSPSFDGSANVTGVGTLAIVNANTGSYGSSTVIPTITVNAKGLITGVTTNAVIAPAGTLTGTTLAANVVNSSLTSVGTITSGTWNGTAIGDSYISSSSNWNTAYNRSGTGLTFTSSTLTFTKQDATTLTVAVPTFNQNTTGSAATLSAVLSSSLGGAGTVSGILKANGAGTVSAAVAGTDYVVPTALSSYVPYTGATGAVNLGSNSLTAGVGTFSGNIRIGTAVTSSSFTTLLTIGGAAPATTYDNGTKKFTTGVNAANQYGIYNESATSYAVKIDGTTNAWDFNGNSLTAGAISGTTGTYTYASNQQLTVKYDATHSAYFGARSNGDVQIYGYNGSGYRNILLGVDGSSIGGNVGIGTPSPNAALTVVANDASNPSTALRLSSTSYGAVTYPSTRMVFGTNYASYPAWNLASIDGAYTGSSWGGSLIFNTNNDATTGNLTERMRITSTGNLLIGTATDDGTNKLQVNGGISGTTGTFSGAITAGATSTIAGTDRVLILQGSGGGANSLLRYSDGTTAKYSTGFNGGNYIIYDDAAAAYRISISSAGAVTVHNLAGTGDRLVYSDGTGLLKSVSLGSGLSFSGGTLSATGGTAGTVTYSGTTTSGYIPVWTSASDITNSVISQSSGSITISATTSTPLYVSTSATVGALVYRANTSTIYGYLGNGSYLLTGALATDFILRSENDLKFAAGGNNLVLTLASGGAATFASSVSASAYYSTSGHMYLVNGGMRIPAGDDINLLDITVNSGTSSPVTYIQSNYYSGGAYSAINISAQPASYPNQFRLNTDGTATFSSSVSASSFSGAGTGLTGTASSLTAGAVNNSVTFNNGGAGAASGTAFNGGSAVTVSYNTIGAQPQLNGTGFVKASGTSITYDNSTYLTANQSITLSGDISGSGTTSISTTLAGTIAGSHTFSGVISLTANTASTAYTNGTLVVTGGVGISGDVNMNGTITAAGGGQDSDLRLKTILTRDMSSHRIADKVSVIKYVWNDKKKGTMARFGYGAQELLQLIPEAVYVSGDHYAVDYSMVHTVLIDENTKRIQALEKEVAELKKRLVA